MTHNYEKGRLQEEQVVKFLQWHGFLAVASRGSHGDWDIIALPKTNMKTNKAILIQAGPKTSVELTGLQMRSMAYQGNGLFFHLKKEPMKSPKVKYLQMHRTNYISIEIMLSAFYGVENVVPFFKAVRNQEQLEREIRRRKKGDV